MVNRILRWNLKKMSKMITKILENKFDCFIIIEGNRGLGKSTLAINLARRVAREFKKKGKKKYKFKWYNSLIYTKKQTKKFWHKWESLGIADEMINVTFNRDFYDSEQKDIIKMINMNRDHCNFFIACVPQFQTLDNQIENLCKIRLTVVRRGVAVVQTPNRTIYIKDQWDQRTNEKIEREWVKKGIRKPQYSRLTTFRGLLMFPKLSDKAEKKYQEIKDKKRNLVAKEEMGLDEEEKKEKDPVERTIKMLQEGKVKNGTFLDGIAHSNDYKPQSFKGKLRNKLKEMGVNAKLTSYYWEKKSRERESGSI